MQEMQAVTRFMTVAQPWPVHRPALALHMEKDYGQLLLKRSQPAGPQRIVLKTLPDHIQILHGGFICHMPVSRLDTR
ncbi:MAG: hypothetical protein OXS28_17195 [Gammaproteobacteria bacterium]|nr:hypothetical protein [Gammaproteobacteria bacterium]